MLMKFIVTLLPILIYTYIKTRKSFQMLQQNWYNDGSRYIKWINKNLKKVFYNLDILFVFVIPFIFIKSDILLMVLVIVFYTFLSLYNLHNQTASKLELKVTKRVKRLFVTELILYLIPNVVFSLTFKENNLGIYYLVIGLMVYLNYYVTFVANLINKPI